MRSRTRRILSSMRASSSGVTFWYFLFFAILVLQELADPPHLVVDVGELTHDSRDVAMLDRRFDDGMLAAVSQLRKASLRDSCSVCARHRRGKQPPIHWIWLIIVGAIVGGLGRLFHPGSDPMGWIVTILIGIASLVIAGIIFSSGWLEFIVGIIVAVVLVALVGRFFGERRTVAGP